MKKSIKKSWTFTKSHFYRVSRVLKVKSDFSVYFSIESSNPKIFFCIINLVYWQVYRVEKVVVYMLSLANKSIFVRNFHVLYSNCICFLDLCPISLNFFCMISIVHSSKCWEHFFNLDLFLNDFWRKSWKLQKSHFSPLL